jgi:hypothetical protein
LWPCCCLRLFAAVLLLSEVVFMLQCSAASLFIGGSGLGCEDAVALFAGGLCMPAAPGSWECWRTTTTGGVCVCVCTHTLYVLLLHSCTVQPLNRCLMVWFSGAVFGSTRILVCIRKLFYVNCLRSGRSLAAHSSSECWRTTTTGRAHCYSSS